MRGLVQRSNWSKKIHIQCVWDTFSPPAPLDQIKREGKKAKSTSQSPCFSASWSLCCKPFFHSFLLQWTRSSETNIKINSFLLSFLDEEFGQNSVSDVSKQEVSTFIFIYSLSRSWFLFRLLVKKFYLWYFVKLFILQSSFLSVMVNLEGQVCWIKKSIA